MNEDRCVCCGDIIPEGRHICPQCETKTKQEKIFICSPFGGDKNNLEKARQFCRYTWQLGKIPIAPHLYFPQFLNEDDEVEREIGIELGKDALLQCTELWIFGDRVSAGMQKEIDFATVRNIPIKRIKVFGE